MMLWTLNSKYAQYVWYKHYAVEKRAASSVDFSTVYSHSSSDQYIWNSIALYLSPQRLTATAKYTMWTFLLGKK